MSVLDDLQLWIASCLVLGLRIAPLFTFAPPFSLTKLPRLFHVLFGLGLSVALVSGDATVRLTSLEPRVLIPAALMELAMGMGMVLIMQLCFAALHLAGRLVDIQAGFGLASVIDPGTNTQSPLVGTLFAYALGSLFFAMDGHVELVRILAVSLKAVPLGAWSLPASLDHLLEFTSAIFIIGLGVAGAAILVLFLVDFVIALLAKTVPQMNVLVMGFQVKTIALFVSLPLCFGFGGAIMVRMIRMALEAMPGLF